MPTHYNKLPASEKTRRNCDKMREPAVTCPLCEAKTPVDDLLAHIRDRCPGKRELHPRSRWVTWSEAVAMGVPAETLKRWVLRKRIRRRGPSRKRRYLARDIVKLVAARWATTKDGG